jgi:membrane-anchored protein YejM (alkaline phosphatase superfamily)
MQIISGCRSEGQENLPMNFANSFRFELPTKIEYGIGAVRKLIDALNELKATRVLIVTDKGIEASGQDCRRYGKCLR